MASVGEGVTSLTAGAVVRERDDAPPPPRASTRKIVAASAIGTVIEWYDFFVYGTAAALIFGRVFFPASDPTVSTLAGLSVYAVGYVARPLGGVIFGHFGDRVGRKSMLVLSVLLMGFGTFLVGLLPTYEQIGILAPILLIMLRLLQAVGLGGEWGGAVLLVSESAPAQRRGLFGSLVQLGNPTGRLIATGVFALAARLPEGDFLLGMAYSVSGERAADRRRARHTISDR
jgi:MFS transporter, MHS family, shikimate and dehydroshikimate transport protein